MNHQHKSADGVDVMSVEDLLFMNSLLRRSLGLGLPEVSVALLGDYTVQ